jgi:hypothetical protein
LWKTKSEPYLKARNPDKSVSHPSWLSGTVRKLFCLKDEYTLKSYA